MNEITQRTEAEVVASLAAKPFLDLLDSAVPAVFIPTGDGGWQMNELHHLLDNPIRKKGRVPTHDVASFITLVERYKGEDTIVYIDADYGNNRVSATAVINDHQASLPGHRDHRITFAPRLSVEWSRWLGRNKEKFSQTDLAFFLEENLADIAPAAGCPSGTEVLTFVSVLSEVRNVRYGSAVNTQNGMVQIEFTEQGDDHTKGKLDLFREFSLGLRPFFGGDGYAIKAFLRYRIDRNSGAISFWYELQRPDRILEDATKSLIDKISGETSVPVVFGSPE